MTVSITGVTGTVSNGQSITISGSGFGVGPTIHKWDNFEGDTHVVGNNVGAGPGSVAWTIRNGSNPCKVSNAENRGVSTKHARSRWTYAGGNWTSGIDYIYAGSSSPFYFTWWWKWEDLVGGSDNWKPYWPAGTGSLPGLPRISSCYGVNVHMISPSDTPDKWAGPPTEDNWIRSECYGIESDPSVANGTVIWLTQWSTNAAFSVIFNRDGDTITRTDSSHWDRIVLGDYCSLDYTDTDKVVDFDDVYIADSRARVEIGNQNTFAASTHREIQPSTVWASGEITSTVNRGSFGTSDTAYLYVVDSDGNVNASGYEITFGEGSSSISPSESPSLSPSASLSPSESPSLSPSASQSPSISPSSSPSGGSQYPRFILNDSPNIVASGENTTGQLTAPDGKAIGTHFQVGRIQDDENPADSIDLDTDKYTEIEWCIQATEWTEPDEVYEFRVTRGE